MHDCSTDHWHPIEHKGQRGICWIRCAILHPLAWITRPEYDDGLPDTVTCSRCFAVMKTETAPNCIFIESKTPLILELRDFDGRSKGQRVAKLLEHMLSVHLHLIQLALDQIIIANFHLH